MDVVTLVIEVRTGHVLGQLLDQSWVDDGTAGGVVRVLTASGVKAYASMYVRLEVGS